MQVNNQRKVFVPVVNYHQRDVYMDEGTMGSVEVCPDVVSDLTQSLELADCDSSVESRALEAGVAAVSTDGGNQLEALAVESCAMARQHSPTGAWEIEGLVN